MLFRSLDRMGRMAAHADRHFLVSGAVESLAVDGGIILGHLVDAQRRIVLPHEAGVGMTTPADLRDLLAPRFADVAFGAIHRSHSGVVGIAAMAGDAAETFERVDVLSKIFYRLGQPLDADRLVAGDAAFSLRLRCRGEGGCRERE